MCSSRADALLVRRVQAGGPAVDADGWFSTGDVATIDEHGFVHLVDRSKDVIKSGGASAVTCVHTSTFSSVCRHLARWKP